jgi:hypothetical protein
LKSSTVDRVLPKYKTDIRFQYSGYDKDNILTEGELAYVWKGNKLYFAEKEKYYITKPPLIISSLASYEKVDNDTLSYNLNVKTLSKVESYQDVETFECTLKRQ